MLTHCSGGSRLRRSGQRLISRREESIMKFLNCAVLLALVSGCSVPVAESEPIAEVSAPVIVCATASNCPWEWKDCSEAVCGGGVCAVAARATGTPCTSGVGVCLADQTCKKPVGVCKPQDAPAVCRSSADCIDQEACTWGSCDIPTGLCHYVQDTNGGPCTIPGSACNWGLCCEMPAGSCERPTLTPTHCTSKAQCDDLDSCTWDSCELGICRHAPHPNGTYCQMHGAGEGQCNNGQCCLP